MSSKRMELYNFNFDFIKSDNFKSLFLEYHMENSKKLQKTILSETQIPASTYSYAKSRGLATNERLSETLCKYFELDLTIDEQLFNHLTALADESITESYFANGGTEAVRVSLSKLDLVKLKKTPLWFLYTLVYLSSIKVDNNEDFINFVDKEIIDFLKFFIPILPDDVKYTFYFSYAEFAMFVDKDELYPELRDQLELYTVNAPRELRTMGEYDLFTLNYLLGDNSKANYYLLECEKLYLDIYNPKRLMTLKQNIISLAFLDKNYSLVIQRAKSSLLGMSRSEDIKPLMYTGSLGNLISSLILTRQYNKALKYSKQLLDFNDPNYSNQAYLFNLYIYLKMKDFTNYDLVVKSINTLFNEGKLKEEKYTCYQLIDSLKDKNKKDMSVFGEKLKPIINNTLLGLTKIGMILKKEYEIYLKDNNKYIDVLDMKV